MNETIHLEPKRRPLPAVLLLGAAVCLIVVGIVAWWWRTSPAPTIVDSQPRTTVASSRPTPRSTDGYVGSEACTQCHGDIAKQYASHPMAQSFFRTNSAPVVEHYDQRATFAPTSRLKYLIERTTDATFHHEVLVDAEGKTVHDQAMEVRYTMGSGKRGRSYLVDRGGWFYMSPISWYSKESKWDLSPGYHGSNNRHFGREVVDECIQCHVGRPVYEEHQTSEFVRYPEPRFAELGIGCERCHGPGEAHVTMRKSKDQVTSDPIVNPRDLPPMQREAVCNQCHLQGELRVPRYGRAHRDFRPGDQLGDIWSVFVRTDPTERSSTPAVSQVEQMFDSKCFLESKGRFGCISCHNPHSEPEPAQVTEFFQHKCATCHATENSCTEVESVRMAAPFGGSCIACHMPKFPASDIPHTVQTDHRILRRPTFGAHEATNPTAMPQAATASMRIFDLPAAPISAAEQQRAEGLVLSHRSRQFKNLNLAAQSSKSLTAWADAHADDQPVQLAMASNAILQGDIPLAVAYWRIVIAHDPTNVDALFGLSVAAMQSGDTARAMDHSERFLAYQPNSAIVHRQLSDLNAATGEINSAIESALRACHLEPWNVEHLAWLEQLYRRSGDASKADAVAAKRLAIAP